MRIRNLLSAMLLLAAGETANLCAQEIVGLSVNYQSTPMGVEGVPVFGWQMRARAGQYNLFQRAYRLMVADSEEELLRRRLVYDSHKRMGSTSVCISPDSTLIKQALKSARRYWWKVQVWDNRGKMTESSISWFETAMQRGDWGGAQWIASPRETVNPYTMNYIISYDVTLPDGKGTIPFIFGCQNDSVYYTAQFTIDPNTQPRPRLLFSRIVNGRLVTEAVVDLTGIIPNQALKEPHHFSLSFRDENYDSYQVTVQVDGHEVKSESTHGTIKLQDKEWRNMSRLLAIGYGQPKGVRGSIGHFRIHDYERGGLLWADDSLYTLNGSDCIKTYVPADDVAAPYLSKTFRLSKPVKKARLYATARGIYELMANGKQVSEDFYNPGWTDYNHRLMYNTYDVTSLLRQGDNTLCAILGDGWWKGVRYSNPRWYRHYGEYTSLLAKLQIEYEDGTREDIVTDKSWLCSTAGPVVANGLYEGEDYDARREIAHIGTPECDYSHWDKVRVIPAPAENVSIQPYIGQPVRIDTIMTAKQISEPLSKTYIYDMGQNMVGVPRIRLHGKAGQRLTIRYAEMTYPEVIPTTPVAPYTIEDYKVKRGQLYTENYRSALSTDHYICRGGDTEVFEPHFTCHGFRYIEISGLDKPLPQEDVKVLVLNSLEGKPSATYHTSDSLVNKLFQNIQWGERSNFVTVPTDCPQRDERAGWSGDAQIFCRTATYNRMVNAFYHRWLYAVRDGQRPNGIFCDVNPASPVFGGAYGWAEVGVVLPWQLYLQYGDTTALRESYTSMKRYLDYGEKRAQHYIQPFGGYGDWVAIIGTQSDLTNTCFFALDAQIMSQTARILGHQDDARHYKQLFDSIRKAFNARYVGSDGLIIAPVGSPASVSPYGARSKECITEPTPIKTQTAYILPLQMNLFADTLAPKVARHLADLVKSNGYRLNTGFIGTPYLNLVLSKYGYDDIAYRLLQQKAFPSWIYPVIQGATTMWERWNSYTLANGFGPVSMNSFNHYAYGAVEDWMMSYSAGIEQDATHPGYHHFVLQPRVGGHLDHVSASFVSPYGLITSSWRSDTPTGAVEQGAHRYGYTYTATVPANTKAILRLSAPLKNISIVSGKAGITSKKQTGDGRSEICLTSGQYQIHIK